jgi:DUF1680 family protein
MLVLIPDLSDQIELDSKFGDILELCLYNAVLTGMSDDGKAFTYVNQLASSDEDLSERHEWFDCACCPPNVTRTLGILGGYVWTFSADAETGSATVNVHLYTAAALQFQVGNSVVKIVQSTNWPWNGNVAISISIDGPPVAVEMRLRMPGWSSPAEVSLHSFFEFPLENKTPRDLCALSSSFLNVPMREWTRATSISHPPGLRSTTNSKFVSR